MSDKRFARAGDSVVPKPAWNASLLLGSESNRLAGIVKVEAVIDSERSQSGVLYRVRTSGGQLRDLDAAWFE